MSMTLTPRALAATAFAALGLAGLAVTGGWTPPRATAAPAATAAIAISPNVPGDLATAAPAASLNDAATFAWNEFFALNWAAAPGKRDTAATNCAFGQTGPGCSGPLVWQTFRGKAEIFPGQPSFTSTVKPPGYDPSDPRFGYDTPPRYGNVYPFAVPQCPTTNASQIVEPAAWLNLDETDEITLANMFAGSAPSPLPSSAPFNSAPQLVRFLAKANHVEYMYVAKNKWWGFPDNDPDPNTGSPAPFAGPQMETMAYVAANHRDPAPGSSTLISLPNGSIEIKAGWRVLTAAEAASHAFVQQRARYYENANNPCWLQATFGLVALHIIQKTPSAPYFVYATFEQSDNIKTAAGVPVEDVNGGVVAMQACAAGQASPCPTSPTEQLVQPTPPAPPQTPGPFPVVNLTPAASAYCTRPQKRIYYLNEQSGTPTGGFICVNRRDNDIPTQIQSVNAQAHAVLASYLAAKHITHSPFAHYKLVNVQYQPIDKPYAGPYRAAGSNPNTGANPASYHLANIVVETNRSLQRFSGGLSPGISTDYNAYLGISPPPVIHQNVFYAANGSTGHGTGNNMGGCMGCHGSQGQLQGGNFSVIFARGATTANGPEVPSNLTPMTMTVLHATRANAVPRHPTRNRHLVTDRIR